VPRLSPRHLSSRHESHWHAPRTAGGSWLDAQRLSRSATKAVSLLGRPALCTISIGQPPFSQQGFHLDYDAGRQGIEVSQLSRLRVFGLCCLAAASLLPQSVCTVTRSDMTAWCYPPYSRSHSCLLGPLTPSWRTRCGAVQPSLLPAAMSLCWKVMHAAALFGPG
jgi:hypothetical protein